jgi:hypothetical protein
MAKSLSTTMAEISDRAQLISDTAISMAGKRRIRFSDATLIRSNAEEILQYIKVVIEELEKIIERR